MKGDPKVSMDDGCHIVRWGNKKMLSSLQGDT